MDIKKDYSCLEQNCVVFQKCLENDEDYQETLPAYCDDVFRVVKCITKSYITSTNIDFGELKLFGRTEICLTYLNENSKLCYADFEEEFSKSIDIENLSDKAFVQADINTKFTSFRLINQRKVSIHNSTSVKLTVYDKLKHSTLKSCENSKLKSSDIKCATVIDSIQTKIEFDEEVSLTNDGCCINKIISSSSFVTLDEIKIIKDKALVKATVKVQLLYIQEGSENILKYDTDFSLSKIVDSSGIIETDISIARLTVGNMYFKLRTNQSNDVGSVEIFGDISLSVVFIRENSFSVISDGYLLKNQCQCSYSDIKCRSEGKLYTDKITSKLSLNTTSQIKEILEIDISPQNYDIKDNCIVYSVNANVLYISTDDEIISNLVTDEIKIAINDYDDALAGINIISSDYSISSQQCIDLRLCLNIDAYLYNNKTIKVLNDIYYDDEKINAPALTVYFASKNESVWSIAKTFASDSNLIIKENDLSSDVLDCNRAIIIPGV